MKSLRSLSPLIFERAAECHVINRVFGCCNAILAATGNGRPNCDISPEYSRYEEAFAEVYRQDANAAGYLGSYYFGTIYASSPNLDRSAHDQNEDSRVIALLLMAELVRDARNPDRHGEKRTR
jgi:hypothetical protein